MQTFRNLIHKLTRPTLLALLGLVLFTSASQAAKIHYWVFTKGTWALVVPGSDAQGGLRWDSAHGRYYTAWAARGEPLDVTFQPTAPREYTRLSGYYSTCATRDLGAIPLPYDYFTTVPINPNCDNNYYWIFTNVGYTEERLPIGARR